MAVIFIYIFGFTAGLFLLYRKETSRKSAVILIVGSAAAVCIWTAGFLTRDKGVLSEIAREEKSGGKKTVVLEAESEGDRKSVQMQVFPQEHSKKELKDLCKKMWGILEEQIVGENDSLDCVTKDLFFPEKVENYPFTIEWKSSDPKVLSERGKIGEDIPQEGVLVEICAHISSDSGNFEEEHIFYAFLFPSADRDAYWKRLEKSMKGDEKNTRSKDSYLLPDSFEGKKVTFYKKKRNMAGILFLFTIVSVVAMETREKEEKEKREKEKKAAMEREYPQMVSRMVMLIGAGMTISGAFKRIAEEYEKNKEGKSKPLYKEIVITCREMESGVPEKEAYRNMGMRCGLSCIVRFTALLVQFTKSGGYGLKAALQEETDKSFAERKERAKRLGEEAGTKLLLPMTMMLVLVMVIVMIPAFTSFGI